MVQSSQQDGRLDTVECGRITATVVEQAQAAGQPLVFDLTGVDFVASAFLRLCIMVQQKAASQPLTLVNVAPPIKKVFKIAGLDQLVAR